MSVNKSQHNRNFWDLGPCLLLQFL